VSAARLAVTLAAAACVAWTLKALAIWNAGGNDISRLEAPLFVLGLLLAVAACAVLGVSLAPAALARRILAGMAGAAAGLVVVLVVESVVGGAAPDDWGWVKQEVGLWAAAIVVVAVTALRYAAARGRGP
jgi:hypothetical protein